MFFILSKVLVSMFFSVFIATLFLMIDIGIIIKAISIMKVKREITRNPSIKVAPLLKSLKSKAFL